MNKWLMRLLRIGAVLLVLAFAFWALVKLENAPPSVEKGHSVVLYDAEDYARSNRINENADATSEYIFLNHGQSGIISAFDWSGAYCFSIVTGGTNGIPELYCCGDTLYVIDKSHHVFVYDGPTLMQDYQIESPVNSTLRSELRESSNHLITLSDNKVHGPDGEEIMTVAGIDWSRLSPTGSVIVVAAFVLVALTLIWICVKDVRKSSSPLKTLRRR